MPVVLITMPSSSPLPITLVSPVTTTAPASSQVSRIERWMRTRSARGEALFDDHGTRQRQHLGGAHHREVVHRARHRQPSDVPAGKEHRVNDVRIGRDDQPAVAHAQRRAVVHRRQPDLAAAGSPATPSRKTCWIRLRMAAPPAPYFSVMRSSSTDSATISSPCGCGSRCKVGMPSVLVPDPARAFAADHARADRRVRHALLAEQRAVGRAT